MKQTNKDFKPNVDLMKAFQSQIMLINDTANSENGMVLHKAGADGPPIHTHPKQEEIISVVRGQLEVYLKNKWITLTENMQVFVPKNTPHTYRSRHVEDCLFEYRLTPNLHFSEMMQTFERLQQEGKLKGTDLKSIIYLSMSFKKFKEDVVSISPPDIVISLMAGVGKLAGFRI